MPTTAGCSPSCATWSPDNGLPLPAAGGPVNLTPFLLFDGNCAEAMAFYQACLGGELTVTKVGDTR